MRAQLELGPWAARGPRSAGAAAWCCTMQPRRMWAQPGPLAMHWLLELRVDACTVTSWHSRPRDLLGIAGRARAGKAARFIILASPQTIYGMSCLIFISACALKKNLSYKPSPILTSGLFDFMLGPHAESWLIDSCPGLTLPGAANSSILCPNPVRTVFVEPVQDSRSCQLSVIEPVSGNRANSNVNLSRIETKLPARPGGRLGTWPETARKISSKARKANA
jgi:hypothetical protein